MPIKTRCNQCLTILTIADDHIGKRARCPRCRAEYTVPPQSDPEALDTVCHFCGAAILHVSRQGTPFNTCEDCQQSIEENEDDLAAQRENQERARGIFVAGCIFFAAVMLVFVLLDLLKRYTDLL